MDNSVLTFVEYNIAGNALRAYYDADGKLVFVLDSTVDDRKPNVLLVINAVGNRKWDDILANDYGVDLETVRPKKNNKYQKLDIEYSGLSEYDNLINAYKSGADLSEPLAALAVFREESVRRAAAERLAIAEETADKARETIIKTKDSIDELQMKLRQLRAKLSQQKKQIGREPTKKSASKILRTDAAVDATNEKLRRAKKRLDNAQRRLISADEDAQRAREILARPMARADAHVDGRGNATMRAPNISTEYNVSYDDDVIDDNLDTDDEQSDDPEIHFSVDMDMPEPRTNIAANASGDNAVVRQSVPDVEYDSNSEITVSEPKADKMADKEIKDEDIKPLFDKDPEIMDEEIAFKPIEFGVSSPVESNVADNGASDSEIYENVIDERPLSFTPPTESKKDVEPIKEPINVTPVTNTEQNEQSTEMTQKSTSVLDSLTPVDVPQNTDSGTAQLDSELAADVAPVKTPDVTPEPTSMPKPQQNNMAAPTPVSNAMPQVDTNERPVPPAATLANAAAVRPVSPITGNAAPTNPAPHKPTFIYYILLVLLIALSIFTLWLYQKNTDDQVPDLTATVPAVEENVQNVENADVPSPFVPEIETPSEPVVVAAEEITETEAAVVEEPAPAAEPEPVVVTEPDEPEIISEPAPAEEPTPEPVADIVIESIPTPTPVVEPEPVIESEEEILASKPAYNVSQNENMFVAAPEYDTETLRQESLQAVDTVGPSVVTSGVTDMSGGGSVTTTGTMAADDYAPQSVTSEVWSTTTTNLPLCPDGTAPDVNGCCAGEIYTDMGEMGFNCCPETGGDCFPPLM